MKTGDRVVVTAKNSYRSPWDGDHGVIVDTVDENWVLVQIDEEYWDDDERTIPIRTNELDKEPQDSAHTDV